ncbi:MAG: VWA-like domain-containing protein [Saprospiraceae bacterium]|nr:VWA-like domain-containing protein [Saprospiraceae bacterium]
MKQAPFLADLFIRIPIQSTPLSDQLTLSIQKGHPCFQPPSDPSFTPALLCKSYHHLLHLALAHPLLSASMYDDVTWHLALDSIVNQQIPLAVREYDPACTLPAQFPPEASLFQAWTWWSQHLHEATPQTLSALGEHQLWREPDRTLTLSTVQSWLCPSTMPEPVQHIREESFGLMEGLAWQECLINISGSSSSTRLTWTTRKASRRYGTHPGIRIRSRGSLVVILDTSGSMKPADLNAIFGFLPEVQRYYRKIHIVESDFKVRQSYLYQGQTPGHIEGRGDTFFQPALDYVQQHLRPDNIWYVTDGRGVAPRIKTPTPLAWILCGDRPPLDELTSFPGILVPVNIPPTVGVIPT